MIVQLKPGIEEVGISPQYQWTHPTSAEAGKVKSVWYIALPITSAHRGSHSGGGARWKGVGGQERYENQGSVYPHASLVEMITYQERLFPGVAWRYIDASHHSWEELSALIRDDPPDVVAMTVYTATCLWALILAAQVKRVNPQSVVILGNDHASLMKKEILYGQYGQRVVDYIGDGNNGPFTMMGLLAFLEGQIPLERVPSIAYRGRSGQVVTQAAHTYPLTERVLPDYRLVEPYLAEHYDAVFQHWYSNNYELKRMVTLPIAGGCNWGNHPNRRCLHCSIQGLTPKTAGIQSIIERLEQVVGDLQANAYSAGDSTMGFTRDQWDGDPFLNELAEACDASPVLRGRRFLKMYGLVREFLDSADVHKGFCHTWNVGIEAFDPQILKRDSKGINPGIDDLYRAMNLPRDLGYRVTPSGIVGLPGTTLKTLNEEVQNWLKFVEEYRDIVPLVMIALPGVIPGSRMYYDLYRSNETARRVHGELIPCRVLSKLYIESTTEVTIEDVEAAQQDVASGIIALSLKHEVPIKVGSNSMGGVDENEGRERAILESLLS